VLPVSMAHGVGRLPSPRRQRRADSLHSPDQPAHIPGSTKYNNKNNCNSKHPD
jgi:hypothetical protein